jgi:serine/threonine-protein kinase HipA
MRDNSMGLQLVGENTDAKQAHLRAQAGELVQVYRGIYVAASDDAEAVILNHAVRIARYLYQRAYLSSASSILLRPSADGRLFISGRRSQRTRLRGLEIVQNETPPHPSITTATIGDDLGDFTIQVSSPVQRFLEAFRLRSEHATAVTEQMRAGMAERLIKEFGSPKEAADAVWIFARRNEWYREGEAAERYLTARPRKLPVNKAALDLLVAWHGVPVGRLNHDGLEWRWISRAHRAPPLIRQTVPGKLPGFIESLLPEGWLAQVLKPRDEREALARGRRYMSNISIAASGDELKALPEDILEARLADFTESGRFVGRYSGPGSDELDGVFEENLARLFARPETPRLSGVQIKAPMCLRPDGTLAPAAELPFTHILKPGGTGGFESLGAVEWLCLELGRSAGFSVPSAALVSISARMPPALVVERFDIRHDLRDKRLLALEDFCSILDVPASAKYSGTMERAARALRPLSTDPEADLEVLFKRALFAWLVGDGDMHLKNIALLRIAEPGSRRFATVTLAPLYDSVTTRIYPGLAEDRMALKLNGKDDRLTRDDFIRFAGTIGLAARRATNILETMARRLPQSIERLQLPDLPAHRALMRDAKSKVAAVVVARAERLIQG